VRNIVIKIDITIDGISKYAIVNIKSPNGKVLYTYTGADEDVLHTAMELKCINVAGDIWVWRDININYIK
jgi:hypothetical protein